MNGLICDTVQLASFALIGRRLRQLSRKLAEATPKYQPIKSPGGWASGRVLISNLSFQIHSFPVLAVPVPEGIMLGGTIWAATEMFTFAGSTASKLVGVTTLRLSDCSVSTLPWMPMNWRIEAPILASSERT